MPKVAIEVDETEYQNQQLLTALYSKMMQNPKSRELLTKAAKEVNPNAVTPELDAKEQIRGEIEPLRETIAALQKRIEDDTAAREQEKLVNQFTSQWDAQKAALRKQGWTDEGIEKAEEHAKTLGIANLEVAAAHFEKQNPPPPVAQSSGVGPFDTFNSSDRDNENFKKLLAAGADGDPMVENDMIRQAITDFRSGGR